MSIINEFDISDTLVEEISKFITNVEQFRSEGPLDQISLAKLEEHFKASHIYHSTGIEGNTLTLQETLLVLKEGIDISGKPLKDTMEVQNLGKAYEFLQTLTSRGQIIREIDIRDFHKLVIGDDDKYQPGQYRTIGVIITGSEHKPPEPIEVPGLMAELIQWINENKDMNPVLLAAISHHKLLAIHPFTDGNGRVSRLLMNLILLRAGLPISNIKREDRPRYYEALSFADYKLYDEIINLVYERSLDLFKEYSRIRDEGKRMEEWAHKWGTREATVLLRRESRELELWRSRIRQVFLEFQNASEVLSDTLETIEIDYFDYHNEIDIDKYYKLKKDGYAEQLNAFAITFFDKKDKRRERFLFRYYREHSRYKGIDRIIPLELLYLDEKLAKYVPIDETQYQNVIRLRDIYFSDDGKVVIKYWNIGNKTIEEDKTNSINQWACWFYEDVLQHIFNIK